MKRYAIVGLGSRACMYVDALLTTFREEGLLAGFCDLNQTRMDFYNRHAAAVYGAPVATYRPADFDADGRYRSIAISAVKKDLQVRARQGYYAPQQ